jgi:putative nucleotidyltransferase with HDIG domain
MGLSLTSWAASNAERFLAPLGDRWSHVQQVAEQARRIATVIPREDCELLVASAYLHDVGYSSDLAVTGFHPLDGARWIRDQGHDERLARLVAHHSCATYEARVRGLLDVLLAEFEPEDSTTYDALVFCDMTIGPTGRMVSLEDRIKDIYKRYGPDHEVSRALNSSLPCLAACHDRTAARLAGCTLLADIGSIASLEVMLDTEPY